MISQTSLEEAVLALLVYSSEHATLVAIKVTDVKLFSNRTNQKIAETALTYIRQYSNPPKKQIDYLLENDFRRGEEGKLLRQELDYLEGQINQIDPPFILEQLETFLETRRLTNSLQKALEHVEQGELLQAKEEIFKVPTAHADGIGLWMKDPLQALKFSEEHEFKDYFSTGIEELDKRGVRPERKQMMFMIAPAKKGKSWWLINVGKHALLHHKKLLHITLELSDEITARRYIQSIFSLTKAHAEAVSHDLFNKDDHGNLISFDRIQLQRDSVLNKRKDIFDTLSNWISCPPWVIKEYPPNTLSTEQLYMYLDVLEKEKGFKPDIIIVDYADLMRIDKRELRVDTGRQYVDLRGLAVTKNLALVTASQGNRESETAKMVGKTHVAEDWSKIGTADAVLTYSQTEEEREKGRARINVAAMRDAEDQFIVLVSQNYRIGQFCVDSTLMTPAAQNILNGATVQT